MLIRGRRGGDVARYILLASTLLLVAVGAMLAAFLSGSAPFFSVWVVIIVFSIIGVGLLAYSNAATKRVEHIFFYTLLISIFLVIVWPPYASVRPPGLPALPPSRIALGALLLIFIYLITKRDAFRAHLFQTSQRFAIVIYPLLALLAWRLIGIATSESPLVSAGGVLNETLSVYLPLFAALAIVRTRRDVHAVLITFLAATAVVLAVALYEYSVSRNVFYDLFTIDSEYLENSLRAKLRDGTYRLQATFIHPLNMSEFLVMMVPVAIYMAFCDGFRWSRSVLLLALTGLMAFVIFKTGSRSGAGGFAVVLVLTIVMAFLRLAVRSRNPVASGLSWLGLITTVVVAGVAGFLILDFLLGSTAETRSSGLVRFLMWETGLERAAERPIFGWGQNNGARALGFMINGILTIDSYYLSVLLDAGVPAFALYLFALFAAAGVLLRHSLSIQQSNLLPALMLSGLVSFALIKVVLSADQNHGLVMVLLAVSLVSIDLGRAATPARDAFTATRRRNESA